MKNPNTFNSMPTYGELEKLKELTPPNQMSEERKKAEALVEMFQTETPPTMECMPTKAAIQCAKLCVMEIIESWSEDDGLHFGLTADWWRGVLTELNKM